MTPKQSDLYEFLKLWFSQHGYGPSRADICAGLGLNSNCQVDRRIASLERMGVITREHGVNRSLRLAEGLR
jgi:repressor LexA